jgi:hypothetical protein
MGQLGEEFQVNNDSGAKGHKEKAANFYSRLFF